MSFLSEAIQRGEESTRISKLSNLDEIAAAQQAQEDWLVTNGKGRAGRRARVKRRAQDKEKLRLDIAENEARKDSTFLVTEGQGKRREARVSFGNSTSTLSSDVREQRATGRFTTNRLVL